MGKDYKFLVVNKAATTGGIPLTEKDYYKLKLGLNKPATAGSDNGKRLALAGGGLGGTKGAGGDSSRGWGGVSTFSPTDRRSTSKRAVKVVNEYCYEEENRRSATDDASTFSPAFTKTAVKVRNEYYVEEENCGLFEDGDAEGEKIQHTQDDDGVELVSDEDDGGAEMGDDGSGWGGDHKYNDDVRVGGIDARAGSGDDFFDGGDCYGDVAGVFDGGYDDDGEDGADFWW